MQAESDGQNEVHVQAKKALQPEDILTYVVAILGEDQVKVHQSAIELELIFWLYSLPSLQADALGLPGENAINMHIKLPSESDNEGQHRPAFKFSIGGEETALHIHWKQPCRSKVLYQISKICEAFIAEHWPCKSEDEQLAFLVRLYRHIQVSISQLGRFCVICGSRQEHTGLKPVPCNLEACNHAFDEHGIGTDLRDIYSKPMVADLLITMASAACRCTSRRNSLFKSLPSELDLNTVHSGNNIQVSPKIDWHCMKKAFANFPSVATMASMRTLDNLFPRLGLEAGVRLRLLRSVLNSCRGHLMQLQGADQFPMMATEYQFWLCTNSPPKEATFAQLKSQRGSQYLFHGSPFYNWHCILREGLKNMSGSSLMSTGDNNGSGIYLAEDSSISAHFCRYKDSQAKPAYLSSIFGEAPWCIALCEVITPTTRKLYQAAGTTSNIYIVPDAQDLIVRYLFVYRGPTIPRVQASELREQCDTHTTMRKQILETNCTVDNVSQEYQQPTCSSYSRCSDSAEN